VDELRKLVDVLSKFLESDESDREDADTGTRRRVEYGCTVNTGSSVFSVPVAPAIVVFDLRGYPHCCGSVILWWRIELDEATVYKCVGGVALRVASLYNPRLAASMKYPINRSDAVKLVREWLGHFSRRSISTLYSPIREVRQIARFLSEVVQRKEPITVVVRQYVGEEDTPKDVSIWMIYTAGPMRESLIL